MRAIDCTIALDGKKCLTLRTGMDYEITLKDNQFYTGKLHSFCIDGNTLEHITLSMKGSGRLLLFGRDIESIRRAYVHS